jgi:protein tyrosine phosphatase (PTP) superfamily phosphohydrolase (DUF442 family)
MRITALCAAASLLATPGLPDSVEADLLERLSTTTGKPFAVFTPEVRGISRFAQIEPGLARGGQPTEEGIRYLRERGFRTVVGLRANQAERRALASAGIVYVEIPLRAGLLGAKVPSAEQARLFLSVVSDSARRPVFFHCRRGRDRTGALAAIYRIEAHGWTPEEAVEEMRALGFSGHYKSLLRYVRRYVRERRGAFG